jgi:basic amino acid/polyamine antiporter, APA family
MSKGLFAKKKISDLLAEAGKGQHGLKRTLGAMNLTTFGIGAIIGAGIFVITGQAAAQYAGPAITISFIIAGIISLFAALCYAELASLIPISGSAYAYAYVTMGEFVAWTIGWGLTLEYLFSATTVAVGWSSYFVSFLKDLGVNIPQVFSDAPFIYSAKEGWQASGTILNLPAMFIVAFIGVMIALGIKTAQRFNDIMVFVKMSVIVLFIVCGIAFIQVDNWLPFIPENTGVFGQYGWSGIFRGAGLVFFGYIGFDALSTLAQETRNPQRDLPLGMIGSLSISTIAYIIMALVLTGIVSYTQLNVADPIAVAVKVLGPKFVWLRFVANIAILAGLTTVILVMLLGQTRIFYSMAKDGLLPHFFSKIHPRFHTPFASTLLITFVAMIAAGLFPVIVLGEIVVMGALLAFAIVCFGVLVLRYKQPNLKRPFKVPFFPWIPALGTLTSIGLMASLSGTTWVQLIVWLIIGCFIYFFYSRKHSKVVAK